MKRSLRVFLSTCLISLALLLLAQAQVACTPFLDRSSGRQYQILWPSTDGRYELQRVAIGSFTEPDRLSGEVASLLVEPTLGANGLEGDRPVGRFIESKDGTLIPSDFITHQGTVVYAHMERLRRLDRDLGVGGDSFIWPARIGLRANVADADGIMQNNAIYDGVLNALILVPYTDGGLPLTFNGGVLAHEHFHAIFQHYVLSRLGTRWQGLEAPKSTDESSDRAETPSRQGLVAPHVCGLDEGSPEILRVTRVFRSRQEMDERGDKLAREVTKLEYNRFLVRGLNEGLADFWGWLYSGDAAFVGRSLRVAGEVRDLSQDMATLPSRETIRSSLRRLTSARTRSSLAYTFGSHYARFLRRLALDRQASSGSGDEFVARMEVAKALVEALPTIADAFEAGFETEFISPEVALKPLLSAMSARGLVSAETCSLYDEFILAHGEPRERSDACPPPRAFQRVESSPHPPPTTDPAKVSESLPPAETSAP